MPDKCSYIGLPHRGQTVHFGYRCQLVCGGVLNQVQEDQEVVITFASQSFRLSQRRYCKTRREMLAAVVMCTHLALWIWLVDIGRWPCQWTISGRHEGLFQFRVMPFGLCNAPATFECLMDRVICAMRWSRCLVYLDDVISFGHPFPKP